MTIMWCYYNDYILTLLNSQFICKVKSWNYFSAISSHINTWSTQQNGCHIAFDIFKCIFMKENVCILIKILLNLFLRSKWHKETLVWVMAWHETGVKSLSEQIMTLSTDEYQWAFLKHGCTISRHSADYNIYHQSQSGTKPKLVGKILATNFDNHLCMGYQNYILWNNDTEKIFYAKYWMRSFCIQNGWHYCQYVKS